MADVNIGARLQVDTGNSTPTIQQLRDEIKQAKTELEGAAIGSEKFRLAQDRLAKAQNQLSGANEGSANSVKNLRGELASAVPGFSAVEGGAMKLLKTFAALALSPVGLILTALALIFALVKNAMDRSEESTTKIKTAFATFSGVINGVLKFLEPLGKILIDVIVVGLEMVAKTAKQAADALASVLDFLGFDDAADSVKEFTAEMEKSAAQARALVKAEQAYDEAQRKARQTQLQFQKDAEKLRQIRDDESKTLKERIKANTDLGIVLKKQAEEELKLAQTALVVANLRIEQEGRTKAALDAQAAAMTQIVDIQERITGQQSEQLQNENSLRKEAAEKAKAAMDERLAKAKEAREKQLAAEKEAAEKLRNFEDQLRKATQQNELAGINDTVEKKLVAQRFGYDNEKLALARDLEAKKITYEQHLLLLQQLDRSNLLAVQVIRNEEQGIYLKKLAEREAAEKLVADQRAKNQLTEFEQTKTALANLAADETLSAEMKESIISQSLANIANSTAFSEDQKTALELAGANARMAISKAETAAKVQNITTVANTLTAISGLIGQQTAVGKGLSAAAAIINTYQGATKALAQGGIFGFIGAAGVIASGLKSVREILKTPIPGQSGSGGVSLPSPQTVTAPLSIASTNTQLDQGSINAVGNAAAARVFVLDSDVSNGTERTTRLNRAARLG